MVCLEELTRKDRQFYRTEKILRNYRATQARIAVLGLELARIKKELETCAMEPINEVIAGVYFARNISDMPHGTEIADKTARVAEQWRKEHGAEWERWQQLNEESRKTTAERDGLVAELQKIDIAMESLLPKEKQIITLRYVQEVDWKVIAERAGYSADWCMKVRDQAIAKIALIVA